MLKPYYNSSSHDFNLLHGDTFELLPQFNFKFDMIFADPPYFLSSGGISMQSGKIVCVDKGDWDKSLSSEEMNAFNLKWLSLCREKLKDNGTIWISGTYHNIFSVANCLTQLGYKILNVITWAKTNPPPNISCRYFTYSTEFIIWARKKEKVAHYYNYELMKHINGDTQMTDVWRLPAIAPWEKKCTKHPTQKPLGLLSRIIMASTKPGAWILDPFAGSSTTGIAANLLGRRYLGIEREEEFAAISKARREEIENDRTFVTYKRKIPDIVKAEDTQTDCFTYNDAFIERLPFLEDEAVVVRDNVFMYAIGSASRSKTEPSGKLAIGIKEGVFDKTLIGDVGYIVFHYWNNEKAKLYKVINTPKIVNKKDIPDGFLLRMDNNAKEFLLLEYDLKNDAEIGSFDIKKVQRTGKGRYMPFITELDTIKV
ncbi:MAG: site-specific DNA-methyltransferase [Prevotella sp.]|nr:site-specific DNA-methyltransferase [Paludibacteraceae bacterium]MBR4390449.1 site-specific DNA-methyltransferase [Prevotella sp.]